MTARYLMMLALALGMGCSGTDGKEPTDVGDDDDDDAGDDDDDDTAPTGDPGPPGFDARNIYINAQFGYNATARAAQTVDFYGNPLPPAIEVILATPQWQQDYADQANYCYIVLPLDNSVTSQAAIKDARLYWGAQYQSAADPYDSNCNTPGWELDPNVWGSDPVGDFGAYYGDVWFIAVGDPTQEISDLFAGYPDLADLYLGGAIGVPPFLGDVVNDVYGFAYEVDANLVVQFDAKGYAVNMPSANVNQGGNIAQAWYSMDSAVYWSLQ